eukprot:TRINITY_DN3015_c0_g1_i1.p1 TRINITY_DN3015_c0_g1~~TRINITY_DN3015_c0_g1_i1.p1  ORF type:complete len:387 (-),score=119.66 TRINITY_DN3015_c0_g1_i1:95-1255(-)
MGRAKEKIDKENQDGEEDSKHHSSEEEQAGEEEEEEGLLSKKDGIKEINSNSNGDEDVDTSSDEQDQQHNNQQQQSSPSSSFPTTNTMTTINPSSSISSSDPTKNQPSPSSSPFINTPPSLPYYVGTHQAMPGGMMGTKQNGANTNHANNNNLFNPTSPYAQQQMNAGRMHHPHSTFHLPDEINSPNLFGNGQVRGNHEGMQATSGPPRPFVQHHTMGMSPYGYPYELHVTNHADDGRGGPSPRHVPVNWSGSHPQEWIELEKNNISRPFGPMSMVHMGPNGKMDMVTESEINSSHLPMTKPSKKAKKAKDERFSWSDDIHQLFVECVETLADMATAKTVMTLMIAKGADPKRLTRIRVANHLQYHYSRKNKLSLSKLSSKDDIGN